MGTGVLCNLRLPRNEIFATIGSALLDDGKFTVILRSRDGTVYAYKLAEIPPPFFKVTDNNTYTSYPPSDQN